jgi:hypothetical protein
VVGELARVVAPAFPGAQAVHGPREEARRLHVEREVEPDDGVGSREDEVAELAPVAAVDHPRLRGDDRLDRRSSSSGVSVQFGPWTSASNSTNGAPSRSARARSTVVFPLPLALAMIATRRMAHVSGRTAIGVSDPGSTR